MGSRNYPPEDKLRRYLCFELIQLISKFSTTEMCLHPHKMPDSRIAFPWKNREHAPADDSLMVFADVAEAATDFFEQAPFGLLADEELSLEEVDGLISVYRNEGDALPYVFPDHGPLTDIDCWDQPCGRNDSASLALRGDIYGFFAILALVREAEAKCDYRNHIFHLRNLCQCLPMLGRFSWLRVDYGFLFRIVRQLRDRVENTESRVGIYWDRVTDYFLDPYQQMNPLLEPIDPSTLLMAILPNMTYVVTASDVGEPPPWPIKNPEEAVKASRLTLSDFPYEVARGLCADRTLLLAFASIAGLWEIPPRVTAMCLGVESSDLPAILEKDSMLLKDKLKTRVVVTLSLLDQLGEDANSIYDCGYILRRPMDELQGESVLSMLDRGQLYEVAEALKVDEFLLAKQNDSCFVAINNIRVDF